MSVQFPVLVLEKDSGEIIRFDSLAELQRQLERIDVDNQEYLAWDAGGYQLTMATVEPMWLKVDREGGGPDKSGLFSALKRFGESRGVELVAAEQDTSAIALHEKIAGRVSSTGGGILNRLFKSHKRR